VDAEITGVYDIIGLNAVTVICPVSFPYILPASASLECTYNQPVSSAAAGKNTAKVAVSTTGKIGGALVLVLFTFGEPTTKVNECITVVCDLQS
jgi:hypothetical protein